MSFINWQIFVSIYFLIFLAELPDKTAFATILMASRARASAVFVGVAAAFLVQTIVAVLFGGLIGLLPPNWVQLGAGIMFLVFSVHTWWTRNENEVDESPQHTQYCATGFWPCTFKSFMVIFIAEWGDLTQIATASLAAKYRDHVPTVFFASLLALWTVTIIAIFIGQKFKGFLSPIVLKKSGAILFALLGVYFIFNSLKV